MKRNVIFYSFLLFICFLFFSCLSPYSGPEEETTITITMGNPGNERILVGNTGTNPEFFGFDHELFLNGVRVPDVATASNAAGTGATTLTLTATVTLAPGANHISIRAYDPNNTNSNLTSFGTGTRILRAVTASSVTISSSHLSSGVPIPISMTSAMEVNSWAQLREAVGTGVTATAREEIIFLKSEASPGAYTATGVGITIDRSIYLRALDNVTINRGMVSGDLFIVGTGGVASGRLNLQGSSSAILTLDGDGTPVNSPLITVSGGTLEMHDGVHLQNNHNTVGLGNGGAVSVTDGRFNMHGGVIGSDNPSLGNRAGNGGGGVYVVWTPGNLGFEMRGGTIMNNTADHGGGVFVFNNGAFTMHAGDIRNNRADLSGGGVRVQSSGFNMYGGIIGSTTTGQGNTAQSGGGVSVMSGTFNMSGNASVHGNEATGIPTSTGGGVLVTLSTHFSMDENASVRNNMAHSTGTGTSGRGGGVAVRDLGTIFEMRGNAVIRNNEASGDAGGYGGGVYVEDEGAFRLAGGTVYGNMIAAGASANTAPNGAALYVQASPGPGTATATFGPGGTSFGGTPPFGRDDTITQDGP